MDPITNWKAYWSILKIFLSKLKKKRKKICILSIYYDKKYITNAKENAQIFNNFFAKECTLLTILADFRLIPLKKIYNFLSKIS